MKIAIAGASGLVGSALVPALRAGGHEVRPLVRRAARDASEISWDPAAGTLDGAALAGIDAVINLAGENIGAGRWTGARRERILRSRVDATRTIVRAFQGAARRPGVLLNASAVGIYGERGDALLDETSAMGVGFLPEVCLAWEAHAAGAAKLGVRTLLLRFGLVLAAEGGALARMLPLFRLGLGGRLGAGEQWMSWIAIADVVGAIEFALTRAEIEGPLNLAAPAPVTNRDFTHTLAATLHRPAFLPAPAWALRLAFGAMADEALLASTRAVPRRLLDRGYVFRHPEIAGAFRAIIGGAAPA